MGGLTGAGHAGVFPPPARSGVRYERWRDRAACRGEDPGLFFPAPGQNAAHAKRVRAGCPVRAQCLDHAVSYPERFGVFGGLDERERYGMNPARHRLDSQEDRASMIRNLFHAGVGVAAILVTGRLLAVPSIAASVHHAKYGHIAVIGVLAALALFTAASLWRASRGSRPRRPSRPGLPYAPRK